MYTKVAWLVLPILFLGMPGRAATLLNYSLNGSTSVTSKDANVTATTFGHGIGFNGNGTDGLANTGVSAGNAFNRAMAASEVDAVAGNDYYTFTITASAGQTLNLSTLTFNIATQGGTSSGSDATFFVRTSLDNFSTTVGSGEVSTPSTTLSAYTPVTIDLSGAAYQNLSTITFEIFDYNTIGNVDPLTSRAIDRIQTVALTGAVVAAAVPEPSSTLLLGGSFLLFAACQVIRRGRRSLEI
ncbi:MAG TPA: hypothetical protein VIM58_03835 [Candidatus Methylacidiphilales bacterium]